MEDYRHHLADRMEPILMKLITFKVTLAVWNLCNFHPQLWRLNLALVFLCLFCYSIFALLVIFAFVVLGLVSSALSRETGWKERLGNGNDPFFCDESNAKR